MATGHKKMSRKLTTRELLDELCNVTQSDTLCEKLSALPEEQV
jgi:hypothetical protein